EDQGSFHIGKTAVTQQRDSRYHAITVTLGAKLCRHHFQVYQGGPQTETTLRGLEAVGDSQHADTHSLVALSQPHGTVDQLHKGIVDGKAHAV
ncbi:SufD family Fe-S cluster assembly protein, partial [Haemophilus parainfluenzae]|uniref:SufD family Fe-S cluster assembly protein n=1 Tax=Haemophilus parainfluenzae TaxID=729 RepID=UPI00124B7377